MPLASVPDLIASEYDDWEEFALRGPTLVHVCRLLGLILEVVSAFGGGDVTEATANEIWMHRLYSPDELARMKEREGERERLAAIRKQASRVLAAHNAAKERENE